MKVRRIDEVILKNNFIKFRVNLSGIPVAAEDYFRSVDGENYTEDATQCVAVYEISSGKWHIEKINGALITYICENGETLHYRKPSLLNYDWFQQEIYMECDKYFTEKIEQYVNSTEGADAA